MSNTWHPDDHPRQSAAWHAIREHLRANGSATRRELAAVAEAGSDLKAKTCHGLVVDLCRAGLITGLTGGRNAVYALPNP